MHVQEDKARAGKHVEALHLRIKEHREDLALAKQDTKRMKKAVKAAEVRASLWQSLGMPRGFLTFLYPGRQR